MKKIEKKVYTVEEVDELKKWFDNQTLPQSMQINSSAYSPDLKIQWRCCLNKHISAVTTRRCKDAFYY